VIERLLFQNDACLVINKLPGESSERIELGSIYEGETFPVHRLDMPVTGCLLLAKNTNAAAFLSEAFACPASSGKPGRVEKFYWAIVEKPVSAILQEAELIHWISFDRKKNKSYAHDKARSGSKKAILRYRVIGQGENYIFLEIDLVTGRHHQIRAQLAALGLHIKGDLKYGARRSEKAGGIRLHAYSLAFPNPINPSETVKITALPPFTDHLGLDSLWTAFHKTGIFFS